MLLCLVSDPLPAHRPGCSFRRARSAPSFESHRRIHHAPRHQRPPCESGLCHFSAGRYFPLFARPRRRARANGPKSRRMRTESESLGGISVAKSRTVGFNSESRRRQGQSQILPGCVATAMGCRLCQIPWLQGIFPAFAALRLCVGSATAGEWPSFLTPGRVYG